MKVGKSLSKKGPDARMRAGAELVGGFMDCAPGVNRKARVLLWLAAIAVVLLAAFPYYAGDLF